MREAQRLTDQGERMKLYSKVHGILVEEAPILLPVYYRWIDLVKPWVKLGGPTMTWKDVIIEPY